jgi:hypothetical protein
VKSHKVVCVNGKHLYRVGKKKKKEFEFVFDRGGDVPKDVMGVRIAEADPGSYVQDDDTPWPDKCPYCRHYPIGHQLILSQHWLNVVLSMVLPWMFCYDYWDSEDIPQMWKKEARWSTAGQR